MLHRNYDYGPMDRFCAKHPRFGVPNLMMYVVIGQIVVFVLDLVSKGALSSMLYFWRPAVLQGQVWRLVTFVFVPNSGNPFFLLLSCYFYYWIGRMLEREWGTAKFSLFYFSGVLLSAISGMLLGLTDIYYIHLSIFLVIATMYGELQVLLFFVVPIKMKWMALIDVAMILVDVIQYASMGLSMCALMPLASFLTSFIFTWPFWAAKLGVVRRQTDPQVINFKRAQKQAQKKAQETGGYLHKCAVCGITDKDAPDMEFRYCSKCDGYYCYCANHINNHIHIRQD